MKKEDILHFKKIAWFPTVVGLTLAACAVPAPDNEIEAQIAALSTQNAALSTQVAAQGTQIALHGTYISHLATSRPLGIAPTTPAGPTPYQPVTGSVVIEGQRCCAGGPLGTVLQLNVHFAAQSPFGRVIEMRVKTGGNILDASEMEAVPWEPFVDDKVYEYEIFAANWIGWWVNVQFRDAEGNLSPVIQDDISIEGYPPVTVTP
jgi:hypothetical protein